MSKNVVVSFFIDEEPAHTVVVPRSASVAEVRRRWVEASEDESPVVFVVEEPYGTVLPSEGTVRDLLPPGKRTVALRVFPEEEKLLSIVGSDMKPIKMHISVQDTVEEVMERAKRLFNLHDREARLLTGGRPLVAETSASRQLIGCPTIELDLLCSFLAVGVSLASQPKSDDQLDCKRENRFASDPAWTLCLNAESRVTAWASGDSVSGSSLLHTVVPEEALLCGEVVGVFVDVTFMTLFFG